MLSKEEMWCYLRYALSIPYLQKTCGCHEVPLVHREPFIHSGFRPPFQRWLYYFLSAFQIHNETLNVWSHILASVIFIYSTWYYANALPAANHYAVVMWTFGVSTVTYTSLSATAHLLQSKSELVHFLVYSLDYLGISCYGFGSGVAMYFCAGNELFHSVFGRIYLPVNFLTSLNLFLALVLSKIYFPKQDSTTRKLIHMASSFSQALWLIVPVACRLYENNAYSDPAPLCSSALLYNHLRTFMMLLICGAFFSSFIPEKFFPGYFDILGHSHQIFHFLLIFQTLSQFYALNEDLKHQSSKLLEMLLPSFLNTFAGLIILFATGCIITYSLRNQMKITIKNLSHSKHGQ